MRLSIVSTAIVLLGTLLIPRASLAQAPSAGDPPATSAQVCAPSESPLGSYAHCALWYDGRELRRGADGAIIARPGFWGHMRLAPHVLGDSAQRYARLFERDNRRANVLQVTGVLAIVAGYIVADSYECRPEPTFGRCTTRDEKYMIGSLVLVGAGSLSLIEGIRFMFRAPRSAARSVWWHNAGFAR